MRLRNPFKTYRTHLLKGHSILFWENLLTFMRQLKNHMETWDKVSQSKHKSQCVFGVARDSTSDPISVYIQKSEHRRRSTQSRLWDNKFPSRSSICRALTNFTAWALVNREQVALDAGYFTWRRCITCPMWSNTTSQGSFAQYRIICPPFAGITRIADEMRYYASKSKLAVNLIKWEFIKLNNPVDK